MTIRKRFVIGLILVLTITQVDAVLTGAKFLPAAVGESAWILHVRVRKIEDPFVGEHNDTVRLGLCDVIEVIKHGDNETAPLMPASTEYEESKTAGNPLDPPNEKWKTIIVSLLKRKDLSPVSEGGEYFFLCRHSAMMPLVAGSDSIYPVENGKVEVYAADFPGPDLTDSEIDDLKNQAPPKRIAVPAEVFSKQLKQLSKMKP